MVPGADPAVRFFWEGAWPGGHLEPRRLLFDCELVAVSRGACELTIAEQRHRFAAGMVAIIPPATVHQTYLPVGGEVVRHCVHFDWDESGMRPEAPLFAWHGDRFPDHLVHAVPAAIARCLPLVADLSGQREVQDALELALRLLRLRHALAARQLGVVLRWLIEPRAQAADGGRDLPQRLAAVLRHIDEHHAEALGHRELCRIAGLGSTSLCRLFQAATGTRPLLYVQQVRIRHAQRLLGEIKHPVQDIAGMVGFADANYFGRVFRRLTGQTPGEFRRRAVELRCEQGERLPIPPRRR